MNQYLTRSIQPSRVASQSLSTSYADNRLTSLVYRSGLKIAQNLKPIFQDSQPTYISDSSTLVSVSQEKVEAQEEVTAVAQGAKVFTLDQAIIAFLADIQAGHSLATAKTYRVALSRFTHYLLEHLQLDSATMPVTALSSTLALNWARWVALGQPPYSSGNSDLPQVTTSINSKVVARNTINTYIAGVRCFYKWCLLENCLEFPTEEYERMVNRLKDLSGRKLAPNLINKVPNDITLEKLVEQASRNCQEYSLPASELEAADPQTKSLASTRETIRCKLLYHRNLALLETLRCTGARVSEIIGLKWADLDEANQRARVKGKGAKERWVYLSPPAWKALQEYYQVKVDVCQSELTLPGSEKSIKELGGSYSSPSTVVRKLSEQAIFTRHDRGSLSAATNTEAIRSQAVGQMLKELTHQAGLEVKITPHYFRHWFATKMLAATNDLATTQDLLGHANPATTRIYAQVSENSKQLAHRNVFRA